MNNFLEINNPFAWDPLSRRRHLHSEVIKFHAGQDLDPEDLERYFDSCHCDFILLCDRAFAATQKGLEIKSRHYKNIFTDSQRVFKASSRIEGKKNVKLVLSLGLFLALDDLILRVSCNKDYFSFDPLRNGKRLWVDGQCLWVIPHSYCRPRTRFYNYTTALLKTDDGERKSWLGGVVSAYPLADPRQNLANLMMHIAITWIVLHEEQHYLNGHLEILKKSASQSLPNLQEGGKFPREMNLEKLMEWQADGAATKGVLDIFLAGSLDILLPSYCQGNRKIWAMRLILSSVTLILLLIQNAEINEQIEDFDFDAKDKTHPHPQDRLLTIIINMLEWNQEKSVNKLNFDDLSAVLIGSICESNTASMLLGSEGNSENQFEEWQLGIPPKAVPQKTLEMLDDPESTRNIAYAILSRLCGFTMKKEFPDLPEGKEIDMMGDKLFSNYDREIVPFIKDIESATKAWRQQFVAQ